jgi:hypothetical protein
MKQFEAVSGVNVWSLQAFPVGAAVAGTRGRAGGKAAGAGAVIAPNGISGLIFSGAIAAWLAELDRASRPDANEQPRTRGVGASSWAIRVQHNFKPMAWWMAAWPRGSIDAHRKRADQLRG